MKQHPVRVPTGPVELEGNLGRETGAGGLWLPRSRVKVPSVTFSNNRLYERE
jgi:hypothetical protein